MKYSGFFEAPVDGDYQFHQSCDDSCQFHMATDSPMDPSTATLRMYRHGSETDYDFRSFATHKYSPIPTLETIDESTTVNGISWTEYKLSALDAGWTSTPHYTNLLSD